MEWEFLKDRKKDMTTVAELDSTMAQGSGKASAARSEELSAAAMVCG
jgi:hypothetical protein